MKIALTFWVALLLAAPGAGAQAPAQTVALKISWTETSVDETGFTIEQKKGDGSYVEVGRVGANVTSFRAPPVTGVVGSRWCYAVRAYKVWSEGEVMSGRAEGCLVMPVTPPGDVVNVVVELEQPQP